MYESPVQLKFNEIKTELIKKENEMIVQAVQEVVPNVTEEELVKALRYDRGQYEKGFLDGRQARDAEIVRCKDCEWWKTNFFWNGKEVKVCVKEPYEPVRREDYFCADGERREDE